MRILTKAKNRKQRSLVLSLCFLCGVFSVYAQDSPTVADTLNRTRLQSVSSVSGDRLLHRPVFQMESFLDGTLPGLYVNMSQGYPTNQLVLSLRGRSLLIVVDGVPRSDANIPASQIESVSVIKDGLGLSTMGTTGGNGILYIKTKRGGLSTMKIDFTAQYANASQVFRPEFLGAYDYAKLLNEGLVNDGKTAMYSQRDLDLYQSGASPYTHPDVDWYDVLMRNNAPIQQYNLNMSGGNENARYFIDLNMYDQKGFLKQDKSLNAYDTQETFKKYSLRTNIDIQFTENTLLRADIFGQMFRENTPGNAMMGSIYKSLHSTPNSAYPITNPVADLKRNDTPMKSYGGNLTYSNNLYAQVMESGYIMYPKTDFNFDVNLTHKFNGDLKGLYASVLYSYNSTYRETLAKTKGFDVWWYRGEPGVMDEETLSNPANFTQILTGTEPIKSTDYNRQNRLQYAELAVGYDFAIDKHTSKTKVLYSGNEYITQGTNFPTIKQGLSLRSEYDYDQRFLAEVSISAMSLNTLKPGHQWGIFPAAGLGWNLVKEDFLAESVFDALKLRTTYGINGSDGSGAYYRSGTGTMTNYYYNYLKYYGSGGSIYLGGLSSAQQTLIEAVLSNTPKWETIKRFTVGVDLEAFNRTLTATVEFFNNNYCDMFALGAKGSNGLYGIALPNENMGAYRQNGLELDLGYNNKFGDLLVNASIGATFYKTKVLVNGESVYPESYMQWVGRSTYQIFGYVSEGLFQTQDEIDQYVANYTIDGGYIPQRGDLKYKDLNGDHIIDGRDIQAIGTDAPRIEYGIFLGAEWKGLGFNMQWSGLANRDIILQDMPFGINSEGGYGQALKEHLDRWTPENTNARYPRVSAVTNIYNERTSTFWLKDADYLRLKNVEVSYTLPKAWTSAIRFGSVKLFANGYNLLTISGIKDRDPELLYFMSGTSTGIVPNNKAYNFGINVQF
ncbi:MAG: SusC/RagA family TonB-linked outer membrane protein [Candidatus Symbiothrix sp.]|nr:SusC/RagA family TonB-linked outer membrane protein [Candidatus Symbiothrix sp.]